MRYNRFDNKKECFFLSVAREVFQQRVSFNQTHSAQGNYRSSRIKIYETVMNIDNKAEMKLDSETRKHDHSPVRLRLWAFINCW